METITRKSDNEISIRVEETIIQSATYSLDFLMEQLQNIKDQKQRDIEQRDKEIENVERLIAEAKKLGVTESTAGKIAI